MLNGWAALILSEAADLRALTNSGDVPARSSMERGSSLAAAKVRAGRCGGVRTASVVLEFVGAVEVIPAELEELVADEAEVAGWSSPPSWWPA